MDKKSNSKKKSASYETNSTGDINRRKIILNLVGKQRKMAVLITMYLFTEEEDKSALMMRYEPY